MLLCGRLQESLTRCFVLCQILMLEYTHANGITILTINKKLMHQFTFNRKAKLAVNVNRFFILFIDDQIQLIEIESPLLIWRHGLPDLSPDTPGR